MSVLGGSLGVLLAFPLLAGLPFAVTGLSNAAFLPTHMTVN